MWVFGCPHITADTSAGRSSMSSAISDIESSKSCHINFAIGLGDFSSNQNPSELATYASEGVDCRTQLGSGTNKVTRDKIYTIRGNHDAGDGQNDWYDTYISSQQISQPYPYLSGATDDYRAIQTGNIIWIFLDDINHGAQPCGRSGGAGGFPSGSTSLAAYNYWVSLIEDNPDCMIITCAHHLLKNTTIATGDNEGVDGGYHGSSGQGVGSGRLHNVITDLAQNQYEADQSRFMDYMAAHPSRCAIWFGSHTHYDVGETYAGRGYMTTVNGCCFVNVGGLTLHHAGHHTQSKIITLVNKSDVATMNNFLHDTSYSAVGYNGNTVSITLPKKVQL